MIARLLFLVLFVGFAFILYKLVFSKSSTMCDYCEGMGFWKGVRGERNFCKKCDGTGQKISK